MTEAKKPRGFARMSKDALFAICQHGGQRAHALGRAHRFVSETARAAGSLGGKTMAAVPGHMSELGRRGGLALQAKKRAEKADAGKGSEQ